MKYLLLLAALMLPAMAQQLVRVDPDCPVNGAFVSFTAGGQAGPGPLGYIDNRATGCSNWTLTYEQVGSGAALQIELQSAPDNGGVPGVWSTFVPGVVQQGANPSTVSPFALIQVSGYAPFVRVLSDSQSANIIGFVFGSRSAAGAGVGPNVPCPGTMATPCFVNNQLFTGVDWIPAFVSTQQTRINVSAGTAQTLVPINGASTTYLTHISFAMNTAADASIVTGTMTTTPCDTGQTVIAGPYKNITALALDFSPLSALQGVGPNDTCLLFSATVTAGGVAIYAQF